MPIDPTISFLSGYNAHMVSWLAITTGTGSASTGAVAEIGGSADRSVQIEGTFDGATVVIQGSNDGSNWQSLTDPQGNAISKAASALEAISELTRYIRPSVSGSVNGTTSINVYLYAKRSP